MNHRMAAFDQGGVLIPDEIFKNIPTGPNRALAHWGALGYAYSRKGEMDKVNDCFEKLKINNREGKVEFLNWNYALIYLALNEIDKMFEYLEKSLEKNKHTRN